MTVKVPALPSLAAQADRLIALGVHSLGGLTAAELRAVADEDPGDGALLVLHPERVPALTLTPLLERDERHGFVVEDMRDVDDFAPIEEVALPERPAYVVAGLERGDEMLNWTPDDAATRSPLTLSEGIHCCSRYPGCCIAGAAS